VLLAGALEQLQPRHVGHHHIGQHQVARRLGKQSQRLMPALRRMHLVALFGEGAFQHTANVQLVVYHKYRMRHRQTSSTRRTLRLLANFSKSRLSVFSEATA
jgi:hypothetical protein